MNMKEQIATLSMILTARNSDDFMLTPFVSFFGGIRSEYIG